MAKSRYRKIVRAIQDFRVIDLPRIQRRIAEQEKSAQVLRSYFHPVREIEFENIGGLVTVAIDGGLTSSNYESIHLAIATAHTFSAHFSSVEGIGEENEAKILRIPSTESNLVFSTYMKALEFEVATRMLKRIQSGTEVLFLFDGAFTYPESEPVPDISTEAGKAIAEYSRQATDFFSQLMKKKRGRSNLHCASISKDAIAGKFLKGLEAAIIHGHLNEPEEGLAALKLIRSEEAFTERFYLSVALSDHAMTRTDFVKVSDQIRKGMRIPVKMLDKEGIYGAYLKPFPYTRPFYIEIPRWDLESKDRICELVCKLSWISPRQGYPYPLIYADRLAKVTQDLASDIFRVIEQETRNRLGKKAHLVFDVKFRRKVGI